MPDAAFEEGSETTWDDLLRPGNASSFFDRVPRPRFDPELRSYGRENAWWLAELSRLVYRHDEPESAPLVPSRRSFLEGVGLREIRFFDGGAAGSQAILVVSDRPAFAALVFRGTEQAASDFGADLADLHVRDDASVVDVHSGFRSQLDAVWTDIVAELEAVQVPVYYAGHSLGAALAILAAGRKPPKAVYAFGSPRVGNRAFAASISGQAIHRVVDGDDVVTVVPPEALGFVHVGLEQRIGRRSSGPLSGSIAATLRGALTLHKYPPKFLADHAPKNCVERLYE
jgi:triacylglycerol lipase